MSKLLTAKPIVEKTLNQLIEKCSELKNKGLAPKMAVILVGDNQASLSYIKNKKKLCQKVGAKFELIHLKEDVSEEQFLLEVKKLNTNNQVSGCFIQLPVPKHLRHLDTSTLVNPDKDVDGFHHNSSLGLYFDKETGFIPCTPKGILKLLNHYEIELAGKNIVVIGRSFIVGKPLSLLLSNQDATVTLCHSKTKNLKSHTQAADIIISAVGSPKFLDLSYINKESQQVVIDVGINRDQDGNLCGDVDFDSLQNEVHAITPVPGSVGPLTVLSLIENLLLATEKILNKRT